MGAKQSLGVEKIILQWPRTGGILAVRYCVLLVIIEKNGHPIISIGLTMWVSIVTHIDQEFGLMCSGSRVSLSIWVYAQLVIGIRSMMIDELMTIRIEAISGLAAGGRSF